MQPTSKDTVLFSRSDDVFTDCLSQTVQKLWPIITSYTKILACVGC